MKVECFRKYRHLFYFFQYMFAVRGESVCNSENSLDLLNTMLQLVDDPIWFHFQNEYRSVNVNNSRKNRQKTQPGTPIAIDSCKLGLKEVNKLRKQFGSNINKRETTFHGPILFAAKKESLYRNIMLNEGEWLITKNGRIWNDFINLYRALIIYDFYTYGETAKSIYDKYGSLCLDEVLEHQQHFAPRQKYPVKVKSNTTLLQDLISYINNFGQFNSEPEQFILESAENDAIEFIGRADDCDGPYIQRIKKHHKRAVQLIKLAETGAFKTFPKVITPL